MDLSFFTMPIHPIGRDYAETLAEDREAILLADRLGFKDAFVGEHVTDLAENITSSAIFIASLASETKSIRLGTGTANLSQSHPALIAGHIAMLDHLLKGRLNFGISPGALRTDAEALGILDKDRGEMFVECINHVLAIWASEPPYYIPGKYWTVSTRETADLELGMGAIVRPYQRPHPPIFGTVVAPHSKGISALAARGWRAISANFLLPRWVATHWPLFLEGRARAGLSADPSDWYVAKSIFVNDDESLARRYALEDARSTYRYYYSQLIAKLIRTNRAEAFKDDRNAPDSSIDFDEIVGRLVFAGSPERVAEQILGFREQVGCFGTLLYAGHDWLDPALARRSMELTAREVMPRVNARLGEAE